MIGKMLNIIQESLLASIQKEIKDINDQIMATYRGEKAHSQEVIGDMADKIKRLKEEKAEIISFIAKLRRCIRG